MHIVNVIALVSARSGGPPAFVGPAAVELQHRGHTVTTLTSDLAFAPGATRQRRVTPAEVHPALTEAGYSAYPARWPRRLAYCPTMVAAARDVVRGADVVHIHSLWLYPQFVGYRASVEAGVPYIVSPHGALDPALARRGRGRKALTTWLWQRRMLERATLLHLTTQAEAELIRQVAPRVPRATVPVGIELAVSPDAGIADAFRRTYLDRYNGPIILFLGRLSFKKGIDLLIRAFARVQAEMDCRLVIVGPDDEGITPSLRVVAARCGVSPSVDFLGPLFGEQKLAAFAAADLFALSSHTENFGVAVAEAMAAGCPVVISEPVNLAPEIRAAGAGLVVKLTEASVAEGLRRLVNDSDLRERLRREGPRFAKRYALPVVVSQLEQMYRTASAMRRTGDGETSGKSEEARSLPSG